MTTVAPALEQALRMLRLMPRFNRWAALRVVQAGGALGLSLRQYAALLGIRDGASSPTELARRWHVTPAVVTGVIDRLARRGLVRREADLTDRRRSLLVLTESGLAASQALERALAEDLAAQLASASFAELGELDRALGLLERALDALQALAPALDGRSVPDEGDDMEAGNDE